MKLPLLRTILLTLIILCSLFYIVGVVIVMQNERSTSPLVDAPKDLKSVAIFGASGTAGDGILEATMDSPDIEQIYVISRRFTPRIENGVASGKVQMILHQDYLDYSQIIEQLADVDAVYWAIGLSSIGVDEKTYGMIHVDFPMRFIAAWSRASMKNDISFHYISSSDISDESTAMWAREKVRAEKTLFAFATKLKMRVIAYRPDYIGPTKEEAHLGQEMLYAFFAPVGAAVRAKQIGQAMLEVTARRLEFNNGDKLHTNEIIRYSDAYEVRRFENRNKNQY